MTQKKKNSHLLRGAILPALRTLAWQKFGVDVGYNTSLGDDNIAEELVQSRWDISYHSQMIA